MSPTILIRFATAALVGAMFLPAQSPAEGRRPAAKASAARAAEQAQVQLADLVSMLQDDTLSPERRAEATHKLEQVLAALAAEKATPVAGQPAQSADGAKASKEVVVVRSSRDSSSAQDSQSSSSSSSSGSGSSRSDTAKATDESSGRAKGKGRARTVVSVPGAAAESSPPPAQEPQPPAPDSRIPTPPKPAKAPKAPKPPKAPRATGALPDAEPPPPPAEGSAFEVSSLEPGTFLLSTEPPEGMTAGVSIEIAEPTAVSEGLLPLVISEEHLVESAQPDDVSVRVRAHGLPPLVLESLEADGNRARLLARVLEMRRAQVDQARELVDVELRGTMEKAKADMDLARLELEVAQRAMAEAKERMLRDVAVATEAELQALDADRVTVLRAVERKRAAEERAAAERDVPPRHVERHTFEVQKKQAHTRAQDAEIRALVEEMRAEMREIRALMREMRAHAGAAPAAGDRLLYVDERRVETKDEAVDAAKDANRAGRPVRLRWAGEKAETRAPEAPPAPRVRWLRAEPAPKPQCEEGTAPKPACEEEEVQVSTSVGVATFPAVGGR